jgi:hypothetical protein
MDVQATARKMFNQSLEAHASAALLLSREKIK